MNQYNPFTEISEQLQILTVAVNNLTEQQKKNPPPLLQSKEEYLDIEEASKLLHMPIPTIRHHKTHNGLPYKKPGKQLLFVKKELQKWVEDFSGNQERHRVQQKNILQIRKNK